MHRVLRSLLVTTLVGLALGDGPGHHGSHHDAHHHGAHHPEHHGPAHATQHAASAHPPPRPAPLRAAPRPQPTHALRPQPVRGIRPRPRGPVLRPRPNPLSPLHLAQRQKLLGNVPRPVRGLQNNLPDRPPVARPVPHLRRPNPNLISASGPTKKPVFVQPSGKTVAALIAENEHFSTLHTALKAAGMMERLAAQGPFTIFAPTNAAFDKVPVDSLNKLMSNKEELVRVLERHIVPGVRMEGKEVPSGNKRFKSAAGEEIITDRSKFVKVTTPAKSAFVVKFDFLGNNGVFHAVDQVL